MSTSSPGVLAVPGGDPTPPHPGYAYQLGMLSTFTTTFVGLVGQGYQPSHALAITMVVCVGGAEIIRRLPGPGDGGQGGPRWA